MIKHLFVLLIAFNIVIAKAQNINGIVTNQNGIPINGVSVFIKNTSIGTATNETGKFTIQPLNKNFVIIFKAVNYQTISVKINQFFKDTIINITLNNQQYDTNTIVVKTGDNPAIKIMQEAIKKRSTYNNQVKAYSCTAYIKSSIKLLKTPSKIFNKKIDTTDVKADSTGNTLIQLSESITQIDFKAPKNLKLQVLSSRTSGNDNGLGPTIPITTNFYDEIVSLGGQLNPRGFIGPLNKNAFFYYKFKLDGVFFEDGQLINRIKIIPRRKYEPLFSGYIMITENTWRIHSIDFWLTKDYQMQILDSLNLQQIQIPITPDIWKTKTQVIEAKIKIFGFVAKSNYTSIFQNYNLTPQFNKNYFNKILLKYDTAFNKKNITYWDSARPVALNQIEQKDYIKKDSIFKKTQDSLKLFKKDEFKTGISITDVLFKGYKGYPVKNKKNIVMLQTESILKNTNYNTVEGLVPQLNFNLTIKKFKNRAIKTEPDLEVFTRYGISNNQFNGFIKTPILKLTQKTKQGLYFLIGSWVQQFNNHSTLTPKANTSYTLAGYNYLKVYKAKFTSLQYINEKIDGIKFNVLLNYEQRNPLNNTTNYSFRGKNTTTFTPNYPTEITNNNITTHTAATINFNASWQYGIRYMQLATGTLVPLTSKYPILSAGIKTAIPNIAGSTAHYTNWKFNIADDNNFKLLGTLKYNFTIGGFLNTQKVYLVDLQHFNGNQVVFAGEYLNTFQLAPYYQFSNANKLFSTLHLEHHFNGFLTNKIPLFNRTKITLVAGANAFSTSNKYNYAEVFIGLENIFKVMRIDWVFGAAENYRAKTGIRLGFGGIFGGIGQAFQK